jgi:predicted SAM-dependent methyltransferase
MRLNLGCGGKHLKGFVNVDFPANHGDVPPDVAADLTKPLPFEDDSAEEIHAYHFIEHVQAWEAGDMLRDWKRVLKPGGLVVIECPCLDKIVQNLIAGLHPRLNMFGLYGDPGYKRPEMVHKWCYSFESMTNLLTAVGFVDIQRKDPQTHQPIRDMRFEARK